ncbi:MAG: ATP-grasp domain-containing protein [Planctomycetales bacterium]
MPGPRRAEDDAAMRIFVSEFLTCGAWTAAPQPSLLREGAAMLRAIALDFARIAGCRVVATWDARLESPDLPGVEVLRADGAAREAQLFRKLAAESDATFVIAPETGGLLAERRRTLDGLGARALGSTAAAIEATADKLRLARRLAERGVRTIPTRPFDPAVMGPSFDFPAVLKPRDGAGSLRTWLLAGPADLDRARGDFSPPEGDAPGIVQPFVPGRAGSVGALIAEGGSNIELLPVAEQRLSDDGRLRYLGGRVPAESIDAGPIAQLVHDALAAVPGLAGYVGCDVVVPRDSPHAPLLVEINPRLTTSYLGYRALTEDNLAERMLRADRDRPPVRWHGEMIEFDAAGTVSGAASSKNAEFARLAAQPFIAQSL